MEQQTIDALKKKLNNRDKQERLAALRALRALVPKRKDSTGLTNNHVHSTYSFSPYSPSRIVYEAYMSGLDTVGIMDHDSVGGAKEFIEAGEIFKMVTTVGFEVRSDWTDTPFGDRRINNPDQIGRAYMCIHGVPHQMIDRTAAFLKPVQKARNIRNQRMVEKLGVLLPDISLSFDEDVVSLSRSVEGGSITERHILFALAKKMMEKVGRGRSLIAHLKETLKIDVSLKQEAMLLDAEYEYYAYDVLNILKSEFVSKMFIPAVPPETPPIKDLVAFCREIGAVLGYAYLGDVTVSPTGDKKAQVFEDAYLDELFEYLESLGVNAVAYMPSRNTPEQMRRVMDLCEKHGLFEISGEDINQPRQSFICEQLKHPDFLHLIDATWALVGHEKQASEAIERGMFSGPQSQIPLKAKLPQYIQFGRIYRR